MDSSSNSEFHGMYDIFLSFRGLDTRKKFTDHLYEALKRAELQTFRDDDEIPRGEIIKSELRKAITNSRMSVIVLSKNYANSTACLFEIQTILEHRKKSSDHSVLPVFYEVDPGEIKEQAKNLDFGEKKVTVEEVKGWRAALEEVVSMAGMVSQNQSNGYEAKFIEEIVGVLKRKLPGNQPRDVDHQELDNSMKILKRKLEYLSAQEDDIKKQITSEEHRPWKRRKTEVEVWLTNVQQLNDDVQRLEQEVGGERNLFSHVWLGKHIIEKIQVVEELQERGRAFDGLLVDEFPAGKLSMPPTEYFVDSTEARNVERVWECLMNDEDRRIGVFGMGGVGKTTIMKHIHNQLLEETDIFDAVFWVTVSKPFNIINLQSDIAKELNFSLSDDKDLTRRAKQLHEVLCRRKRYVLIIDDLWEVFLLEGVGIPKPTRSNGCKLVLTTRLLEVCKGMRCKTVKVELLTEEEALTLFFSKAVEDVTVLAPEVKEIAAQIAKECACLPLAIVTVAGSLQGIEGTREWRNALTELISSTKDANDPESEVFEQLKFSYSRLGNEMLQNCFLYVSLYPEDHNIPVEELIDYWIAEELIAVMNSVEQQFDKGHAILAKLTNSSLLERSIDMNGHHYVRIHDLIRDMALNITASSPRFMVKAGEEICSVADEHWSEDLERISFMGSWITELPITPPFCPRLTTLFLNDTEFLTEIPDSFFTKMQLLEVLNLADNRYITSLPESIFNLVNLHALILDHCGELRNVPSLENLKALTVFILTWSKVKKLPEGIEELVNLVKLDLSNNYDLEDFPTSKIRRLSKLRFLRLDGTDVKVSAEDLKCLKALKVVAVHFPNIPELTRYATSEQCQGLEKYVLIVGENVEAEMEITRKEVWIYFKWIDTESESDSEPLEIGVVDQPVLPASMEYFEVYNFHNIIDLSTIPSLKDARDLRRCVFFNCRKLESIFSYSSFSKDGQIFLGTVEKLELYELPRCRGLFDWIAPLQNISFNLKSLTIRGCHEMENIFPVQILQNFPNLEELYVRGCKKLEDIIVKKEEMSNQDHGPHNIDTINFPKLRILRIEDLPRLKSIYNGMMVCEAVQEVRVEDCAMVMRLPLSLQATAPPSPDKKKTAPPSLEFIEGGLNWWEGLEWDDPDAKGILQPFFKQGWTDKNKAPPMSSYSTALNKLPSDSIDLNKLPDESDELSSDSIDLNKLPDESDELSSDSIDLALRL